MDKLFLALDIDVTLETDQERPIPFLYGATNGETYAFERNAFGKGITVCDEGAFRGRPDVDLCEVLVQSTIGAWHRERTDTTTIPTDDVGVRFGRGTTKNLARKEVRIVRGSRPKSAGVGKSLMERQTI